MEVKVYNNEMTVERFVKYVKHKCLSPTFDKGKQTVFFSRESHSLISKLFCYYLNFFLKVLVNVTLSCFYMVAAGFNGEKKGVISAKYEIWRWLLMYIAVKSNTDCSLL